MIDWTRTISATNGNIALLCHSRQKLERQGDVMGHLSCLLLARAGRCGVGIPSAVLPLLLCSATRNTIYLRAARVTPTPGQAGDPGENSQPSTGWKQSLGPAQLTAELSSHLPGEINCVCAVINLLQLACSDY